MTLDIITSEKDEKEFAEFLHSKIIEFNNLKSSYHRNGRLPNSVKPLNLILKNDDGEIIGGLSGSTYWDWLEIDDFFIPDELRGKGIGTSLLQKAETIAMERGAKRCFLSTFDFQARTFYEKHGYFVVGKLEGYPPNSAYFWMRKDFLQSQIKEGSSAPTAT